MTPSLDLFAVFARVSEAGGFSRAARDLGLSKATVSKRIAELEAALGVQLLARTTRRASLTEVGERVLRRAQRILEEAELAREEAAEVRSAPRGRLRVSAPLSFGVKYLGPMLPDFMAAFPDIHLDLSLSDKQVDLIGDGYDAALRINSLEDSSLVARTLSPVRLLLVGAPDYFAARGRPERPEDLATHDCFVYSNAASGALWRFTDATGRRAQVRVQGGLSYDNGDVIEAALCAGRGVALQPDFLCWEDIAAGRLECALTDWRTADIALHLLTPPGRRMTRKLRAFSDFLFERLGGGRAPWLRPEGLRKILLKTEEDDSIPP